MSGLRPYQVSGPDLQRHLEAVVSATFADLTSQFMLLPRGSTFVTIDSFQAGYEALRMETSGFRKLDVERCWRAVRRHAIAFIVLRAILGVTPPEWQDLAVEETGTAFTAKWTGMLDREARRNPDHFAGCTAKSAERIDALFAAACRALVQGAAHAPEGLIHRLEKFDTTHGLDGIRHAADQHVPYSVLLYERYLGRPFASHRDSISELVGDVMESAIETRLAAAGVPFRKTRHAERIPGFEQAPDFFVPNELVPAVIIEAKITGDDGTARDKISRILRLAAMRDERLRLGRPAFQVIACIDGRGFGVRRQDLRDLLVATHGKVFTAATLNALITHTDLAGFVPETD